jgi:hypothetical protein
MISNELTPEQATLILKGTNIDWSKYFKSISGQPQPALEPYIKDNPELAARYAIYVLHGPFPAGEPAIATDPYWALTYAEQALGSKPFPAGEPALLQAPYYAMLYAIRVLRRRWLEAEPIIQSEDLFAWKRYKAEFGIR